VGPGRPVHQELSEPKRESLPANAGNSAKLEAVKGVGAWEKAWKSGVGHCAECQRSDGNRSRCMPLLLSQR